MLDTFPETPQEELPNFDRNGVLPPGDYAPSQRDFEQRFVNAGDQLTRQSIYDGWNRHRQALARDGLAPSARQLLNGSFTTSKNAPGDIDIAVEVPVDGNTLLSLNGSSPIIRLLQGPNMKADLGDNWRAKMTEDKLLLEEIQDLSKYLDGIPENLRSSGIFAAYDARLNMLQQQLLIASLQKTLKPYGENLNKLPIEISSEGLADPQFLRQLTIECYNIEQSHHKAAQAYIKTRYWINLVVLLSSVSVGLGISVGLFAGAFIWAALLSILAAALTTIEITFDLVRHPLKEQVLAGRLTAMRLELEMLSARSNEMKLETKDINEFTTRLVRLLSETSGDIEAQASDPKDTAINRLNQ